MRGRPKVELVLSESERDESSALTLRRKTAQALALRARIVLACAEGQDSKVVAARHALYEQARQRHPTRWSGNTRDWSHLSVVTLNPERDTVVNMPASARHTQQKAA